MSGFNAGTAPAGNHGKPLFWKSKNMTAWRNLDPGRGIWAVFEKLEEPETGDPVILEYNGFRYHFRVGASVQSLHNDIWVPRWWLALEVIEHATT